MITYRLRGLVNLQVVATAGIATGFFFLLVQAVPYLPLPELSDELHVSLYGGVVLAGMLASGRFWARFGPRFHVIRWVDAAQLSSRQVVLVALAVFTLIVATKDALISRLFLATYLGLCWLLLLVVNRYLPGWLSRAVFQRHHLISTLLVGSSNSLARVEGWMRQKEHLGIRVVGRLGEEGTAGPGGAIPWLGPLSSLQPQIEAGGIGQVILLEVPAEAGERERVVEACQAAGCRMMVYDDFLRRMPIRLAPFIEEEHLFFTAQAEPLEDPFNRAVKRAFDLAVALPVVVLVLPPLCGLVWVVQRWQSPGPLFFDRPRGGQRGREFRMLKFRSMYVATHDPKLEARQAKAGDLRIYSFGHFLRKTSLDEFPQFWNVLRGDMSIVGPRPHLPQHDVEFSTVAKTYRTRQLVKPGITGLAQVSGFRGEITDPALLHQRVQADIEYITNWSIWLDVQITLKTLLHVLAPPPTAR